MSDIDKLIEDTLNAEDRELLDRYGGERGFFTEAMGAFRGRRGWVFSVATCANVVLFFGGAYLAWRFFQVEDLIVALRYGMGALLLFIMAAVMKIGMGVMIEGNRVVREIKRLELQVARERAKHPQ
jgi:uncharacterized membrane protein YciS (DUF1049 family)